MKRVAKQVAIVVGFLAIVALVVDQLTPGRSGPTSSSYATASDGLAAYADLLSLGGHPVTRLRASPAHANLDPRTTVVLLDPEIVLRADVDALRRFVTAGGRLVAGGSEPGAWLSELLAGEPDWSPRGETQNAPLLPTPETAGVTSVQSAGEGSWSSPHATLPVLGPADASLVTVANVGAGRLVLLADSSPLQNRLLAVGDNAAFGLALAGARGRPVAFEEGVHGYGQASGLSALPTRWKWALVGLILAALAFVASRIRRLGPPQPLPAGSQPPRREHVEALAVALARTHKPGVAGGPVQQHARALALRRAGLRPDAGPDDVEQAGERLGLDSEESAAISAPTLGDDQVLAAGRALAKLSGRAS
jgi:Domain of unknown function (DUF4350)